MEGCKPTKGLQIVTYEVTLCRPRGLSNALLPSLW